MTSSKPNHLQKAPSVNVIIPRVCVCVFVSHVQLFAIPRTIARQAPLSVGFPRQEYWRGLPFPSPGDLPISEIESWSPALQADSLLWADTSIQSIMLPKPPLDIHTNRLDEVRLCYCPEHWCNLHCTRNHHEDVGSTLEYITLLTPEFCPVAGT